MSTALYVLADEYRQTAERLANLDLDEQTLTDTLESICGELTVKARNVAMCIRNLETTAEQIKAAEAQMAKRRKALETRATRIRQYLFDNMQHAGLQKVECPYFNIAIRNNPSAVQIDDARQIPTQFMRQPEPPPPAPDKKAIKDALEAGEDVPGARLVTGQSLRIQ
jgi:chromosome segregation ATPase